MAYKNGDILPAHLLKAIQKYVDGEYIYIPRKPGSRNLPDKESKARKYTLERNTEIFNKHSNGFTVKELSREYYLSPKTIYGIIAKVRNSKGVS